MHRKPITNVSLGPRKSNHIVIAGVRASMKGWILSEQSSSSVPGAGQHSGLSPYLGRERKQC